jgi:hypothetical protein
MQPRQAAWATCFAPDELSLIFKAYDDAWREVAPTIGSDPLAIETARMILATVVLGLAANAEPMARNGLSALAVAVFCGVCRIDTE